MSKVLTDKELAEIVTRLVGDDGHDEFDAYEKFLGDLAELVTNHCGGYHFTTQFDPNDDLGWTVSIKPDENVPEDGGIYKDYDPDVTWKDGQEL